MLFQVTSSSLNSSKVCTMIPNTKFRPMVVIIMKKVKSKKTTLSAASLNFIGKSAVLKWIALINGIYSKVTICLPTLRCQVGHTLIQWWNIEKENDKMKHFQHLHLDYGIHWIEVQMLQHYRCTLLPDQVQLSITVNDLYGYIYNYMM